MRLLIVEDNAATRELIKMVCEEAGHSVVTAKNGAEALEKFKQNPASVIISDLVMPVMDGLTLCERIRESKNTIDPFFFLISGKETSLFNHREAMEAGVDDFLFKPVDQFVMKNQLRMVETVLSGEVSDAA